MKIKIKNLIKYMPKYYRKIKEIINIQNVIEIEMDLENVIVGVLNQNFVRASTWGLEIWEKILEIDTDLTLSDEARQENIISKLQAGKTTTIQMLKTMAEVFSGGECDVIEVNEEYYFNIKFIGVYGIPSNMDGFIKAIERVKPAHLGFKFIYTYMTWDEFDKYNKTWESWDTLNLTWEDREKYKE